MAWKSIACLATGVTLSFGLLIVGCAIYNIWYPLILLVIYAATPFPIFGCGIGINDSMAVSLDESNGWRHFGLFIEGFLLTSTIALPLVLYHTALIPGSTFAFTIVSSILMLITAIAYLLINNAGEMNSSWFSGW